MEGGGKEEGYRWLTFQWGLRGVGWFRKMINSNMFSLDS